MKKLILPVVTLLFAAQLFAQDFSCTRDMTQESFQIHIDKEIAFVNDSISDGYQCASFDEDDVMFMVVCHTDDGLFAYMGDENEGAIVQNPFGFVDRIVCKKL